MDTDKITHYICTGGCDGVAPDSGVCQLATCPKHGQDLEPCDCTDGKHGRAPAEEKIPARQDLPPVAYGPR